MLLELNKLSTMLSSARKTVEELQRQQKDLKITLSAYDMEARLKRPRSAANAAAAAAAAAATANAAGTGGAAGEAWAGAGDGDGAGDAPSPATSPRVEKGGDRRQAAEVRRRLEDLR